jgi:hypothetical protein
VRDTVGMVPLAVGGGGGAWAMSERPRIDSERGACHLAA